MPGTITPLGVGAIAAQYAVTVKLRHYLKVRRPMVIRIHADSDR
jgi:hypothetical protein